MKRRVGPHARRRQAALNGCATAFVVLLAVIAAAQEPTKTVDAGVYTEAQAARGAAVYETTCAGCHRGDLGGGAGPALRSQRFAQQFAGKELRALFTKTAAMPRNAPASLGDNVYLDLVAHLLRENGFPAGAQELTAAALDDVRVLPGRPKPPPPIGDFSYVEVVGCLTPGPRNAWLLTRASAPAVPAAGATTAAPANGSSLGTETFHLVDAMAYGPADHQGHKMYVRGLLIRLPDEQRMTISTFEMLSPSCE